MSITTYRNACCGHACLTSGATILHLNANAARLCNVMLEQSEVLRLGVERAECGTQIIDCGLYVPGGLEAGRRMAEICLAGLGEVRFVPGDRTLWAGPSVTVATDQPVLACMASQYAGWALAGDKFFAMGSGPMRAAACREKLFESLGVCEKLTGGPLGNEAIGVLESGKLPPSDVCERMARDCGVTPENLTLLVAPTRSLAGTIQVVARSVETALHKIHELGFDLTRIRSGFGVAPLPPPAADDLAGIGRTNDAVLYGGDVTLWVADGDDQELDLLCQQVPSSASRDSGAPFREIFERYNRDFYKIDPLLFSPAVVTLVNLSTGHSFRHGEFRPDIIRRSFLG